MKKVLCVLGWLTLLFSTVNGQVSSTNNVLNSTGVTAIQSITSGYKLSVGGAVKLFGTGNSGSGSPTLYLRNTTSGTGRNFGINSGDAGLFQVFDSNASNAIRFAINSSGKIGIGTTSPSEQLSIAGSDGNIHIGTTLYGSGFNGIWLNGSTTPNDYNFLSKASDKNLYINRPSGKVIEFAENDAAQMTIAAGGNVGIGISYNSASAKLEVNATNASDGILLKNATSGFLRMFPSNLTSGSYNPLTQTGDGGIIYGTALQGSGTNSSFGFVLAPWHHNAAGLRMDVDGNVGIGLYNPAAPLDVNGNIRATGLIITGGAGANKVLSSDASGNASWQAASSLFSGWTLGGNSGTNPASQFIGTTDNQQLIFKTNNTQAMSIGTDAGVIMNKDLIVVGNGGGNVVNPAFKIAGDYITSHYFTAATLASQNFHTDAGNNTWFNTGRVFFTGSTIGGYQEPLVIKASYPSATQISLVVDNGTEDAAPANYKITSFRFSGTEKAYVNKDGGAFFNSNVGIGTTTFSDPAYKLYVEGNIRSRKVKVDQDTWSDYVFENDYYLRSIQEVEKFIANNKHLPDVPSAADVKNKGLDLGENQSVLLRKIEELTLYAIEQNKQIENQARKLELQQQQIDELMRLAKKK